MVVVGIADDQASARGSSRYELPWSAASSNRHSPGGLVVGVLVLVLDVEHPRRDGAAGHERRPLDEQEGPPADNRAPADSPSDERQVRHDHAHKDPARHAALREAALEQEDEARPDEQHEQWASVRPVAEPPSTRRTLVLGERHRVDLARPALFEVAGVRVMEAVLALPPPIRREEEETECVAPAPVRRSRIEHRVVGEVVEERVHPHEKDGGDQAQPDREPRVRADEQREGPDSEVGQDHARELGKAAAAVDLEIRGEVLLPGLALRG